MSSCKSFAKRINQGYICSRLESSWSVIIECKCFLMLYTFYLVNHMEDMIEIEEDIIIMPTVTEDHLIPSGSKLL